ncbi:MAG: nuclear transport factor 2 family protein [Solirubrobacterales bacterium]
MSEPCFTTATAAAGDDPLAGPRSERDTAEAMSEEEEVINHWVDAWNREDLDGFMGFYDGSAEFNPDPSWPESGPFEGRRAIRGFVEGFREAWTGNQAVIADLRAGGGTVVARIELKGRGIASGIDADLALSSVSEIEDRKITRQRWYLDHGAAVAAAGLPE